MVRSVFGQLKLNGYSDGQILALSNGLAELAASDRPQNQVDARSVNVQELSFEYDLSLLGL